MIAVIFEVTPGAGQRQTYLDIAASLRPQLEEIDGFISIERFQSLTNPEKILSLSFFSDEAAVARWRGAQDHRSAQEAGRSGIFADYRLRIAGVIRDYGLLDRLQAPQSRRVVTDPVDLAYVRRNFRAIKDLDPHLPAPSYYDANGMAYVPHDYEDQERDRERFRERARAKIDQLGLGFDDRWIEDALISYLDGIYGICLKQTTPENIVRKNHLIDRIDSLVNTPLREDARWISELQTAVDELDGLEREFCAFDRTFFGRPVSRDTYVTAVRDRFLNRRRPSYEI